MEQNQNTKVFLVFVMILSFLCLNLVNYNMNQNGEYRNPLVSNNNYSENPKTDLPIGSEVTNQRECYALVCGIEDYDGDSNDLSYCVDDAENMSLFLQSEFAIPSDHIYMLVDGEVTETNIENRVNSIASLMDEDDMFFFSYSGHGMANTTDPETIIHTIESPHPYPNNFANIYHYSVPGAAAMRVHFTTITIEDEFDVVYVGDYHYTDYCDDYFLYDYSNVWSNWVYTDDIYVQLMSDYSETDWGFRVDQIQYVNYTDPYEIVLPDFSGLSGSDFDGIFDSIPGEMVAVFDSCHSGGVVEDMQQSNRYLMAACARSESSLENPDIGNGVFTYSFFNAWDSTEDANNDGVISFEEMFGTLNSSTIEMSDDMGMAHHPEEYDGNEQSVSFYPGAEINSITVNGDNFQVNYTQIGLGYGNMYYGLYLPSTHSYEIAYDSNPICSANNSDLWNISQDALGFDANAISVVFKGTYYDNSGYCHSNFTNGGTFSATTDSDGDGISDAYEFGNMTNPWDIDSDQDGMSDDFEISYGFQAFLDEGDGDLDFDSDGLSNVLESQSGGNPYNNDTDGDNLPDGWEYQYGLNLLAPDNSTDSDHDGLTNIEEFLYDCNPIVADTDGDGLNDGEEIDLGTSPNNTDTDGDHFSDNIEILFQSDPLDILSTPLFHVYFIGLFVLGFAIIMIAGRKNKNGEYDDSQSPIQRVRTNVNYGSSPYGGVRPNYGGQQNLSPQDAEMVKKLLILKMIQQGMCPQCGTHLQNGTCPNCGLSINRNGGI